MKRLSNEKKSKNWICVSQFQAYRYIPASSARSDLFKKLQTQTHKQLFSLLQVNTKKGRIQKAYCKFAIQIKQLNSHRKNCKGLVKVNKTIYFNAILQHLVVVTIMEIISFIPYYQLFEKNEHPVYLFQKFFIEGIKTQNFLE